LTGDVLGTHNGDVQVPLSAHPTATDSSWLFGQLNQAHSVHSTAAVLTAIRGRAALAWARLSQPGYVFLVRSALSPLAVSTDAGGALWWASNPQWLRDISGRHHLDFTEPTMLREGTLLVLRAGETEVEITQQRRFIPTCRLKDERLAGVAVWRGFHEKDRRRDSADLLHRLAR